jgi:hypothetical protein
MFGEYHHEEVMFGEYYHEEVMLLLLVVVVVVVVVMLVLMVRVAFEHVMAWVAGVKIRRGHVIDEMVQVQRENGPGGSWREHGI